MSAVVYPFISTVRHELSLGGSNMAVCVHFTAHEPGCNFYRPVVAGAKYSREIAAARSVIDAAVRAQKCPAGTVVYNVRRREHKTKTIVTVFARYTDPIDKAGHYIAIRTGVSRNPDNCAAAAEACLRAMEVLPPPGRRDIPLRLC